MMLKWHLLPALSAFPNFCPHWDKLNQQLYAGHPLLDSRFVQALLEYFGDQKIILAVYGTSIDQPLNCLLLQPQKLGVWSTFLPSQAQIAPILCSKPDALAELFQYLPGYAISIDLLCQDPEYSSYPSPFIPHDVLHHVVTMNIDIEQSFHHYWQKRSSNLQNNLKRYFNRLKKNDIHVELKINSIDNDLENALIRYGNLETNSWKGREGTAIHHTNKQGRFYLDILKNFSKTNQAEIIELYLDEKLAASRINILNNNIFIILKTTYDETMSQYAPGRLLLYLLTEREFDLNRIRSIEFYTNATKDQLSWSTNHRAIEHITLYKTSAIQKTIAFIHKLKK